MATTTTSYQVTIAGNTYRVETADYAGLNDWMIKTHGASLGHAVEWLDAQIETISH